MSPGKAKASFGGQTLENVIRAIKLVGFVEIKAKELAKAQSDMFPSERLLVRRSPYTTIFGTQGWREYFLHSKEWSGELECKFQNGGGSVDEKMVYVTETLKRTTLPRLALVYGGEYWTKESRGQAIIVWMKEEAKALRHTHQKELLVMTLDEFIDWAGKTWKVH
jgi:hypothetical protein